MGGATRKRELPSQHHWFPADIRKLKAELAAPLDLGEGEHEADGDTASEVSVKKVCSIPLTLYLNLDIFLYISQVL